MKQTLAATSEASLALQSIYQLFDNVPFAVASLKGPSLVIEFINQHNLSIWGKRREDVIGKALFEVRPDLRERAEPIHQQVYRTGERYKAVEVPVEIPVRGSVERRFFNMIVDPIVGPEGNITGQLLTSIDVTEQVIAARKLEEREEHLQLVTDSLPILISYVDREYRYQFANKGYEQWFGLSASDVKGMPVVDVIGEKAFTAVKPYLTQALSGKPVTFQSNLSYKGEHQRYIEASYVPHSNKNGEVLGLYAMVTDITERKKAEEALFASEDRYQNFIRQSTEGIWRFEVEKPIPVNLPPDEQVNQFFRYGYLAECNDAMARMYGYRSAEELTGARLGDFFPRNEASEAYLLYFISSHYRVESAESQELDRYGNTKHFLNNLVGMTENGHLVRAWGTQRDITSLKEAEDLLKESEVRFRLLANAMPQVVWMAEVNGDVSYYNNQVANFEGAEKGEDGRWSWKAMLHPEEQEPTTKAWQDAVKSGAIYEKEHRVKVKEGGYRWHLSRAIPQRDENGQILKWYGTATDIHEQKTAAEQLEKLVEERTKELQRSNEDLQQFAHVASHDLKEPVRKVKIFSGRLRDELGSQLSEQADVYLTKVEGAAERMYRMIEGVLLYSSLTTLDQTKEKIDLNALIASIESDLEVSITQTRAQISYHHLPSVNGSSVLLYQLFYNLVNNSLKFSRPGVPPQIAISGFVIPPDEANQSGMQAGVPFIKIIVEDNGIGFRNEEAQLIFNAFTRLHTKDKFEGTGLGLSLCKKIVERHGGTIGAEGQEGRGAVFTIILPEN